MIDMPIATAPDPGGRGTENPRTTITYATAYGAYGPYRVGMEHTDPADGLIRAVRRPVARAVFIGYGLIEGTARAIMMHTHGPIMTEWRTGPMGGPLRPTEHKPGEYLNLPDGEHGHEWGDPLEIPSNEPARYSVGSGGPEISEVAARAALLAYDGKALVSSPTPRYSLATGGGTIARRVLPQHASMTADEIREWARKQTHKGMLGDRARAALLARVESALAAGGGSGSVGTYTIGSAIGQPIVSFEIAPVPGTATIA